MNMEQPSKKEDLKLGSWIKEAGLEQPSASFTNAVMDAISTSKKPIAYKPLISKQVWFVAAMLLAAIFVLVYKVPMSESGFIDTLSFDSSWSVTNSLRSVQVPNTMVYAICLLGLFWVQIPFLKRWMQKY